MTPKEYNEIKDPDTALSVRLAVTLGWNPEYFEIHFNCLEVGEFVQEGWLMMRSFNPFTDASIPYGLIGHGVICVGEVAHVYKKEFFAWNTGNTKIHYYADKTHAIINAYCQADPNGLWAKFIGEKE